MVGPVSDVQQARNRARAVVPAIPAAVSDEEHRRLVVRLIWIVYLLLIFEGALRKWVAPQFGRQLFFVRDPFVLAIYILVLCRRARIRNGFLEVACLFGLVEFVMLIAQRISSGDWDLMSIILALYGWRAYFFYIPLAFVIARYMDMKDLSRIARTTALISAPIAVLAVVQFFSPPLAPVNVGFGDSKEDIYYQQNLLPGGFVRTSGTFTASIGQMTFTASAVAFAMSLWLAPGRSRTVKSYLTLAAGSFGALVCLSVCGSRGAVVWSALVILIGIAGMLLAPGEMGVKAVVVTLILVTLFSIVPPLLFPEATVSFARRWTEADDMESRRYGAGGIYARAIYEVFNFNLLLADTPVEGYGLGTAGNAAWNLGTRNQTITFTNLDQVAAAESDWGRHILELGPLFGSVFIVFRVALVIWLAFQALRATMKSGHPLPWLLFAFVAVILFNGQITANGTQNGYAWVLTGFCLAAVNTAAARTHDVGTRMRSVAVPILRSVRTGS